MDVIINEITSTVRAVDGDTLLAPETLQKIVQAVLEAVRAHEEHRSRARVERRVTGGIRDAQTACGCTS